MKINLDKTINESIGCDIWRQYGYALQLGTLYRKHGSTQISVHLRSKKETKQVE